MIPSVLANQVRKGVEDFLKTTFPISTPFFQGIIDRLLEGENVFKGPYISVQLPFQSGQISESYFNDLPLGFTPYLHQEKAFERLTGESAFSTIIATGTGSGKTECFLYPILDYCYRHRGEQGIKAILIYPMNALATDQAGRISKAIYREGKLRSNVTAGLFIGGDEGLGIPVMTEESVITSREIMLDNPPDILITNYKMLDYLLVRPHYAKIWKNNDPESLKYLVVDELHTFDGAQGTDLACLIRRLKARLGTPENHLCCVGTSATLGSPESADQLREYAQLIFAESFQEGSVIPEYRLSPREYLQNASISYMGLPSTFSTEKLAPENHKTYQDFIMALCKLWFDWNVTDFDLADTSWRIELATRVMEHSFFQSLLRGLGNVAKKEEQIIEELGKVIPEFLERPYRDRVLILESFLALISESKKEIVSIQGESTSTQTVPFLNVRVQGWLRELRRMVAEVSPSKPLLRFSDDLTQEQKKTHLPLVHCRECGSTGWVGTSIKGHDRINADLNYFYLEYFRNSTSVRFLFPEKCHNPAEEFNGVAALFCPECLCYMADSSALNPNDNTTPHCHNCGCDNLIPVLIPNSVKTLKLKNGNNKVIGSHDCPFCGGKDSLTIVGSRAASITSVMISQLFASQYNNDKKLLTFSDSVQDAAHRAGFFKARTWRFNLRMAIQQFLLDARKSFSLKNLPESFSNYWMDKMGYEKFISTFIAPNMEWFRDYEHLKESTLASPKRLIKDVKQRLEWEIQSEYCFSSQIGRTLEKTRSSSAVLDKERLEQIIPGLLEVLRNEIGWLKGIQKKDLVRFILGFVIHLKNMGALSNPILDTYIKSYGTSTYLISQHRIKWMPSFGPKTRAPKFLISTDSSPFESLLSNRKRTWYQIWILKCFEDFMEGSLQDVSDQIFRIVLKAMTNAGFIDEKVVDQQKLTKIWGLNPESLLVETQVKQFRCNECGALISVGESLSEYWKGAPCLRRNCGGKYAIMPDSTDYYGQLYFSGELCRTFAFEHTGLLDRTTRENIENQFKSDEGNRKAWYPNILSCTPTLEMGIDIGDLSSLLLCSVPPSQANYLQRIGRSGRRDGNSLNLTVANARSHDLFFYSEPENMINGEVETPGVFLNASAILERQFTAFCFDRWNVNSADSDNFPDKVKVVLDDISNHNDSHFPYNFLSFIEDNRTTLFQSFCQIFQDAIDEKTVEKMQIFVFGGDEENEKLDIKILDGFYSLIKERDSLKKNIRTLSNKIRKLRQSPTKDQNFESEMSELQQEKSSLNALVKSINDMPLLNFFTDEGLLPNYAFPEKGVSLKSVIYWKEELSESEEGSKYKHKVYEYERPGSSAIGELAPENHFYASGRKVMIDQINVALSEPEKWRICDNCSYMELVQSEGQTTTCPKCGSPGWGDLGRERTLLRLRQVFANTSDRESRIGDDSDDREPKFYERVKSVHFKEQDIWDAYKIDNPDMPFGFEFISKVTIKEVNFGETDENAEAFCVAGKEITTKGFNICKKCGKIQGIRGKKHALTCTAKDADSDKNFQSCVYLYRELTSEAIRILLPVSTFEGSDMRLHSFIAALNLGLKEYFKGNIDHLGTTIEEEPVPDSNIRKRYLVLFDRIPGGTGYLGQLMRTGKPILDVLKLAMERLKSCPCNEDPSKDGCYQCLFAYRNSYNMAETSRDCAVEMLSDILSFKGSLVQTDTISRISINSLLDSELEAKFIEALRISSDEQRSISVKKDIVNGKPGYFMKIGERGWLIEPQVSVGEEEGVSVMSKPDFVFYPIRSNEGIKPIALFTDGFAYHRDRVGKDIAQRMALKQSNSFITWSLVFKDVENCFHSEGDYYRQYMLSRNSFGNPLKNLIDQYGLGDRYKYFHTKNSFELLLEYLADPDDQAWYKYAFIQGLLYLEPKKYSSPANRQEWSLMLEGILPSHFMDNFNLSNPDYIYGWCECESIEENKQLQLFVSVSGLAIQPPGDIWGMQLALYFNDAKEYRYKEEFIKIWTGFLRFVNILQFLPLSFLIVQTGKDAHYYDSIIVAESTETLSTVGDAWGSICGECLVDIRTLIPYFKNNDWPIPEISYELVNERNQIVATAEMAWPALKIVFLRDDEEEFRNIFLGDGWRVFFFKDLLDSPEQIDSIVLSGEE